MRAPVVHLALVATTILCVISPDLARANTRPHGVDSARRDARAPTRIDDAVPVARPHPRPDDWQAAERLLRLDDAHVALLRRLLALPPDQVDRLCTYLRTDGAARLGADGRVASIADTSVVAQALTLDDIANLLATIQSGVTSISTRLNSLLARVPDRPDVRALVSEVDLDDLKGLFAAVRDDAGGVLAIVEEERAGFQTFVGGANGTCGGGTPCGTFKQDLTGIFLDLEDAWATAQRVECLEKPDLVLRSLDTTFFQTLLVDKAPLVVLFFMQKVLDQFTGWQTVIADGLATIPPGLTQLCESEPPAPAACLASVDRKCCVLRPKVVGAALDRTKAALSLAPTIFKIVRHWTTDDKDATAAAVVGGGAGAGTNVKNPAHGGASTLEAVAEKLGKAIENAIAARDKCVAADLTREQDLFACNGLVEYILPKERGGQFEDAAEQVERRIGDMEAAGLDAKQTAKSRVELARARSVVGTSKGYRHLCAAYKALVR